MTAYKPTPERCAEWIKDHLYTQLAKTNSVEVWRCQTPGTHSYAFDLVMSRYGMAMYGDTGCLTFDVGISYGLPFLAGDDGDYVFRKLDASSREMDLDTAYVLAIVYNAIIDLLSARDLQVPEWLPRTEPMPARVQQLDAWLCENPSGDGEHGALCVALRECQSLENPSTSGAYEWLSEHQALLHLADDMDYSLGKPTNAVMNRIYILRHAAKQILAIKAAAEAPAPIAYAYALKHPSDRWSNDSLASFVSDHELAAGAVIQRGEAHKENASYFLPDTDDVINHMANQASDASEFADNFPDLTKEQEAELGALMEPMRQWVDQHCDVGFYEVNKIEPYTVTDEDVAAALAYRTQLEAGEPA